MQGYPQFSYWIPRALRKFLSICLSVRFFNFVSGGGGGGGVGERRGKGEGRARSTA